MNTNTVGGIALQGTVRNTWPSQAVATTTETILKINTDGTAANYFLTPTLPTTIVGAQTPFSTAANAAITAAGKLLKTVEMQQRYDLPSDSSRGKRLVLCDLES